MCLPNFFCPCLSFCLSISLSLSLTLPLLLSLTHTPTLFRATTIYDQPEYSNIPRSIKLKEKTDFYSFHAKLTSFASVLSRWCLSISVTHSLMLFSHTYIGMQWEPIASIWSYERMWFHGIKSSHCLQPQSIESFVWLHCQWSINNDHGNIPNRDP